MAGMPSPDQFESIFKKGQALRNIENCVDKVLKQLDIEVDDQERLEIAYEALLNIDTFIKEAK